MVASVVLNPMQVTVAQGTFSGATANGLTQGLALDDPSVRFALAGGYLNASETSPMWGGVLIYEDVPALGFDSSIGGAVGRATSIAGATGMSVFNQAHAMIATPQSPVPIAGTGMSVNFYRFGSNARIPVAIDPSLVSLDGGLITQQVSWDFNLQRLVPYQAATGAVTITAMSWANTAGGTVSVTTSAAHNLVAGDDFTITGAVPTAYNGDWTAVTAPTTTTLTFLLPAATSPGSVTTLGSIAAGGGALPCRVLKVVTSGCQTVNYSATTGFATWNYNGACAVILI